MNKINKIGDILKRLRGKMSLREASERSGLSHSYIRYLEQGKRPGSNTPIHPTPDTLRALSKAYNYPYSELMKLAGYGDQVQEESEEYVISPLKKMFLDAIDDMSDEDVETLLELAKRFKKRI